MTNDDNLRVISDELAPPMWYRYLTLLDPVNNHDKFYEVSITLMDNGQFVVKKRWGRRPDRLNAGQTQVFILPTVQRALDQAGTYVSVKKAAGYVETERPNA